jgi:hypothetical protein
MPERSSSPNTQRQKTIWKWESAWITSRGHGFRCVTSAMPHQPRKLHTETKIHPPHIHQNHTASQTQFYSDIRAFVVQRIAHFSVSAIIGEGAIIGTIKTKDNSKGLGLLILHLFSHLGERLHVRPPPSHISLTKPYPLTQSIMQAKPVLSTYNTRRIAQWAYRKHLILKYGPKEVVKNRFLGLRNILEKILRYTPLLLVFPRTIPFLYKQGNLTAFHINLGFFFEQYYVMCRNFEGNV